MTLVAMVKGPRRLAAENITLRHQVSVLRRKHPGRVRLSRLDRIFLSWLVKVCPSVLDATVDFDYFRSWLVEGLGYGDGSKGGRPPLDPSP